MRVTESQLREFKRLYKARFGIDLGDEEALRKASQLLELTKVLFTPQPKAD